MHCSHSQSNIFNMQTPDRYWEGLYWNGFAPEAVGAVSLASLLRAVSRAPGNENHGGKHHSQCRCNDLEMESCSSTTTPSCVLPHQLTQAVVLSTADFLLQRGDDPSEFFVTVLDIADTAEDCCDASAHNQDGAQQQDCRLLQQHNTAQQQQHLSGEAPAHDPKQSLESWQASCAHDTCACRSSHPPPPSPTHDHATPSTEDDHSASTHRGGNLSFGLVNEEEADKQQERLVICRCWHENVFLGAIRAECVDPAEKNVDLCFAADSGDLVMASSWEQTESEVGDSMHLRDITEAFFAGLGGDDETTDDSNVMTDTLSASAD